MMTEPKQHAVEKAKSYALVIIRIILSQDRDKNYHD